MRYATVEILTAVLVKIPVFGLWPGTNPFAVNISNNRFLMQLLVFLSSQTFPSSLYAKKSLSYMLVVL
jgi:hypothetical protein